MAYKAGLFSILCIMGLLSCKEQENGQAGNLVIEVGQAVLSPTELYASDYFEEIRYVPLETRDNCLIGSSPDIKLLDKYILVTSVQKQCFLFDKATGKFKCRIGHVGNDPGGYRNVDCLVDEANGRLLFQGGDHEFICYDLDGNYMGRIKLPSVEGSYPSNCVFLNKDTIVGFFQNMLGTEANRLLYLGKEGKQLALLPNTSQCPPFEINSMSVWKGESAVKEFGPSALRGVIYMEGKDLETASLMYSFISNFWHVGKDTYFMEAFNDTIFQLDGTVLRPHLRLDCGELGWDYKDRFRKDRSKGIFVPVALENERSLFALAITDLYDKDRRKTYNVAFDKRKGITKASLVEKGIKDDMTGFLPVQLLTVSSSGEYGGIHSIEDITKWFDKYGDKEYPKVLEGFKDLEEEQNPVVVLLK